MQLDLVASPNVLATIHAMKSLIAWTLEFHVSHVGDASDLTGQRNLRQRLDDLAGLLNRGFIERGSAGTLETQILQSKSPFTRGSHRHSMLDATTATANVMNAASNDWRRSQAAINAATIAPPVPTAGPTHTNQRPSRWCRSIPTPTG